MALAVCISLLPLPALAGEMEDIAQYVEQMANVNNEAVA